VFGGGGIETESPVAATVLLLCQLLSFAIFIRAILSWFNMAPDNPLVQALNAITEPIISPIRQIMPRLGMLDLSPLVAILLLNFGGQFLATLIDGNL
jgi:YggT family protein